MDLFGSRYLTDESKVFEHNAWDDVKWDDDKEREALEIIKLQETAKLDSKVATDLLTDPSKKWDEFYDKNEDKFFKDRKWLSHEFPMLLTPNIDENGKISKKTILEVGCGVGNTTLPLLSLVHPSTFVYCSDFSKTAIEKLKTKYDENKCTAFVWDITKDTNEIKNESVDIILCIYVLSALEPKQQKEAINNLVSKLKPKGMLLMKDYGRYDLTQLRFKKNRYIDNNFYCRGDGTLVYYFTSEELDSLFTEAGLEKIQNSIDRRLIVNRKKKIKMYRVWMQCIYKKI
uniref:tRNA N(3)-methylcytidine methyltransferase n=1 Tax=Parastrongyloides trichosuri TaxID=131310 RepID=A0A0N4ZP40_PARTI